MSDKDKTAPTQLKNIPKDGQVIMSIMKERGITDYDPRTIVQLNEFVYRYTTSILEEARMYANNSKKKFLDVDDVKLALKLSSEAAFTTPPPREVILKCANIKNYAPLPLIKPHCGLRLPPDRYCLSSCNYALKSSNQKKTKLSYNSATGPSSMKLMTKPNVSYVKRTAVGVPKPKIDYVSSPRPGVTMQQKTTLKPKIQIAAHNVHLTNGGPMMDDNPNKRKREDDTDM